jgi:hypothetical protein
LQPHYGSSLRQRESTISKHVSGIGTNKNMVMGHDGAEKMIVLAKASSKLQAMLVREAEQRCF